MLAEHIRLESKQVVATALAQGMLTPPQAELVMKRAAEHELRGEAHLNIADLMVQMNLINQGQAARLVQIHASPAAPQTFTIGKYLLTNRLGAGAMGTVYLAVDQMLQRKVALKILSPKMAALPEFVSRFKKEARTTAQLNHRNIVHVHDVDETDGFLYYAMEYLEGTALDEMVKKRGPLPPSEAVPYIVQAAKGLEAAHKQGVVHRDVKPANLFLTKDGTVKLVDLGLSKDTTEGINSEHSVAGMAIGTPHYIAPEQARGLEGIDGRADIYGLGCTLYTLLTATTPYSGPNPVAIMNRQINDPPPNPQAVVPTLPAAYSILIELMMAKNPNDRYQNCTELVADLERVLAGKAPMGASVAVNNEGDQDVPTLKRRAVTSSSRGPLGGVNSSAPPRSPSSTGRARAVSALAMASATGEGSSGFRRMSGSPKRATSRYERVELPPEETDGEEAEAPPWYRKYALQLGLGLGGLALFLIVVIAVAASSAAPPPPPEEPVVNRPWGPPGSRPMPPAPAATLPPAVPAIPAVTAVKPPPKDPAELSPYEWAKLHPNQTQPGVVAAPSPAPTPPPPVAAPVAPSADGVHPGSWTPPPPGSKAVYFVNGDKRQSTLGRWNRVTEEAENGRTYLRWLGQAVPNIPDLQYPYFQFGTVQTMGGNYLLRARVRRNNKSTQPLRAVFFTEQTAKLSSVELRPLTVPNQTWVEISGTLGIPANSSVDQFEIRTGGTGTPGEIIEVEWLEIDLLTANGPIAKQAVTPGALLHHDCSLADDGIAAWARCAPGQEGAVGFMHWTHQGNLREGQVTAPIIAMNKGFGWKEQTQFLLKIRLRGIGKPRFNMGVKFYYHNRNGTALTYSTRIDFRDTEWGSWQERTIDLEVVDHGTFDELELRPFDLDVPDGAIDVDWVEVCPKAP